MPTSHPIDVVASPLQSARVIHQCLCGGWVASAPSHECLGRRSMACHHFVEERPARMGSNKRIEAIGRMGHRPGDKLMRALGMMAIPLEKAPRGLRVCMRPVAKLACRLGVMLGPAFEGHRRRGRSHGWGAGSGRRRVYGRRRRISTGRTAKAEQADSTESDWVFIL